MAPWHFVDCLPRAKHNPVREWETKQSLKIQLAFRAALFALSQTTDWRDPPIEKLYRDLNGQEAGLGEIIFEIDQEVKGKKKLRRRRFRAFVKLREEEHDCVLLTCCEHGPRHRSYDPPDAPAQAMKHWLALQAGVAVIDRHYY